MWVARARKEPRIVAAPDLSAVDDGNCTAPTQIILRP